MNQRSDRALRQAVWELGQLPQADADRVMGLLSHHEQAALQALLNEHSGFDVPTGLAQGTRSSSAPDRVPEVPDVILRLLSAQGSELTAATQQALRDIVAKQRPPTLRFAQSLAPSTRRSRFQQGLRWLRGRT